jgi:hypothetical protein
MNKNLLIGAISGNYSVADIKNWVQTSKFEDTDRVLYLYNGDSNSPLIPYLAENNVDVYLPQINFFGAIQDEFLTDTGRVTPESSYNLIHNARFLHIANFLRDMQYEKVFITDVKDVVFQKNPIDYIEKNLTADKNLLLSSESILYKDEPWGNQNLLETYGEMIHDRFKNNEIYNVGVLAGRGHAMRDLMLSIFIATQGRPIPICDQSTFNVMVSMSPYKETSLYLKSEDAWACQLGTTADPSKIEQFRPLLLEPQPKMVSGEVTTSEGHSYTIVHQYDRVPFWRETLEVKYGQ